MGENLADNVAVEENPKKYDSVVTDLGNELMMDAVANGGKVAITDFAVGDGNGEYYRPETGMTALKNEVWRGAVDSCEISEEAGNILIIKAVCPATAGGFTIREMAIFDADNHMIAICNCPATPKVVVTDGVVNEMHLMMEIALLNGDAVELVIDPNIVSATKEDIRKILEKMKANGRVTIGTASSELEENEIRLIVDEMPY